MIAAANIQEEQSAGRADRNSREAHIRLKHHVVELNECGCKLESRETNTMPGEQTEQGRKCECNSPSG